MARAPRLTSALTIRTRTAEPPEANGRSPAHPASTRDGRTALTVPRRPSARRRSGRIDRAGSQKHRRRARLGEHFGVRLVERVEAVSERVVKPASSREMGGLDRRINWSTDSSTRATWTACPTSLRSLSSPVIRDVGLLLAPTTERTMRVEVSEHAWPIGEIDRVVLRCRSRDWCLRLRGSHRADCRFRNQHFDNRCPRSGADRRLTPPISAPTSSLPPEAQSTLPPVATDSSTTVESTDADGVPLAQILEPYETAALESTDFTSYRFDCRQYTGERGPDWQGWELREIGRDQIVERGAVLSCGARTDPPADVGSLDLVVLDDRGATTWWRVGSDGVGHVPVASEGLLCRDVHGD